ncbi:dihydroorotase [Clostridium vitabionis]|uniref:dihydroorotase n=1 Tax=Clostridium vitabionis TaxID=2784388 RepID=UPI00188C8EDC|nr:dihydroorotase [Clostridium vitabionis]
MNRIIRNIRAVDPASGFDGIADIVIRDGLIAEVCPAGGGAEADARDIDGRGLTAFPGLIDVHVHFRDPGLTYKEDILTGAAAAKAGGFTTVVAMANTKPPVDTVETLRDILEKGKATGIHVLSAANVTRGMKGQELTDMEALAQAGAAGFTDDGIPIKNGAILHEALLRAGRLGLPVSLHEEDPAFIADNGVNRGHVSRVLGIGGSPAIAEYSMVARDIAIAADTGCDLDIQHVSSAVTVDLIRRAKAAGIRVWAEVTPHHFTLTEDAVLSYGTLAKMNPPLRTAEDREALIEGLRDGTIDMIATDHAPHSAEEKQRALTSAPSGIIGLETALPLAVTELAGKGRLTYLELADRMSLAPARLYRLPGGRIQPGAPADLVIFDDREEFSVEGFRSKASNSPFLGWKLKGRVKYTICGGEIVFSDSRKSEDSDGKDST